MSITVYRVKDAPEYLQRLLWADKAMGNNPEERQAMLWVATEPKESTAFWGPADGVAQQGSLARAFGAGVRFYSVDLETETVHFFTDNNPEDELASLFG
jgi:hypothetical protein